MLRLQTCAALLLLCACDGVPGARSAKDDSSAVIEEHQLDTELINESSGLGRSHRDPGLLWTHNDSGGKAQAYAVTTEGHYLGNVMVLGAPNLDWEDMTSFIEDGKPRLLLADIGDNDAFRPFVSLYVIDEPDLAGEPQPFALRTLPARIIEARYPDGPRDAESIAVDAQEGFIYILSKRDAVPQLYRLPLAPLVPVVVMEALGPINIPRAPEGTENPERINWTTSMDISEDGRRLAINGLTQEHIYTRAEGETWQQALQRAPQDLDLPDYGQIEAVSFAPEGDSFWITSEGAPAPLARIALPQ